MWYYVVNGQQQGPFNEAEFDGLIAAGTVVGSTYVWKEGLSAWQPLSEARSGASAADTCQVCHRVVGADHLLDLNGVRVCAACKPVALQRIREGIALVPSDKRKRPVLVWVISIFYFVCTPIGAISIACMPLLASGSFPMTPEQRHYFQSQNAFDYTLAGLNMVLNLTGAIYLFRLRRQALICFVGVFVLTFFNFGYQIMFKHWLQVMESQPGGLFGAAIGAFFGVGINGAIIGYVWHLKAKKILS